MKNMNLLMAKYAGECFAKDAIKSGELEFSESVMDYIRTAIKEHDYESDEFEDERDIYSFNELVHRQATECGCETREERWAFFRGFKNSFGRRKITISKCEPEYKVATEASFDVYPINDVFYIKED